MMLRVARRSAAAGPLRSAAAGPLRASSVMLHQSAMLCPKLAAAPRHEPLMSRSMSSQGGQTASEAQIALAVVQWQNSAQAGNAPPLRFPVGTPVQCYVGGDDWVRGTVVKHNYREESWEAERPAAPYQVLLDDQHVEGTEQNAIWAPADVDEIVRSAFRFNVEDVADCRVSEDEWVRCTVVGRMYREADWEEGKAAPYQVRVDGVLPGCRDDKIIGLAASGDAMIWLPRDADSYIRAASAERDERLQALVGLAQSGALGEEEFKEKRRAVIHSA